MTYQLPNPIEEWHPKNEKSLTEYTKGSHFRAWWKCKTCSHEWQTAINNRMRGNKSGCPKCVRANLRGNKNPKWTGFGEISGHQWLCIKMESTAERRSRQCKSHAGLPFEITIEYAWNLFLKQERKCVLSGEPLTMWGKINGKQSGNASLDRIDSSKGYIEENVQWIDKRIQLVKRNWSDENFITLCQKVASYQTKKELEQRGIPSFKEWVTTAKS